MISAEANSWCFSAAKRPKRLPLPAGLPGYEMRVGAERFLLEHPQLRPFLHETGDKLREYFGATAELAVDRFVDPESSSAPDELFVRVKTSLEVEEARERLGRFDHEWWIDNMQRGDYLLNVALEFV